MTLEDYKNHFTEDDAVGWQAIDRELENLYPGQEPKHFAPALYYSLGGENPLDGLSIYESDEQSAHFHFITYGFSELYYNEKAAGGEFSKYGFELTFRLKKTGETDNIHWACNLMENLAKYVFKTGNWFEEYHFFPANGPLRLNYDTELSAIAFIADPELGTIDTPHGEVQFLQMVGITGKELELLKKNPELKETESLLQNLKINNKLLITDLDRK